MPDITMCQKVDCPVSGKCYRHSDSGTVANEFRQAYAVWPDDHEGGEDCSLFWKRTAQVAAAHDGTF